MKFPYHNNRFPSKEVLVQEYKGKNVGELPTPSFVINCETFARNCERMLTNAANLNADFRAHIKTHKTLEGTKLQLGYGGKKTNKIVVSTLAEAWGIEPLIDEGLITDVLYGIPVVKSRLHELALLSEKLEHLHLMVDHPQQLDTLSEVFQTGIIKKKWSIYIKIDMGTHRAGFINGSSELFQTFQKLFKDPKISSSVDLFGFYAHAGHSYASKTPGSAQNYLFQEIQLVNFAAMMAREFNPGLELHLSVGATPTAHSVGMLTMKDVLEYLKEPLMGSLELHAGNYPMCDLQQVATGLIGYEDVACKVTAETLSQYHLRGEKEPGEELINAGVIALGREPGPIPGFGRVLEPLQYRNWIVGRLSQEHGILTPLDGSQSTSFIPLNTVISIIPQHSCIVAASYPWYLIVDNSDTVVDVWVPFTGW